MKSNSGKYRLKFCLGSLGLAYVLVASLSLSIQAQTNTFPSSGNVGVGTTTPASTLHVATESSDVTRGIVSAQHSENSSGPMFRFWKSRGTKTSPTAVANGDSLGLLYADGYEGSAYVSGGRIKFTVDGAVSSGVMPTAVQFFSGNSGGGVERMRISSSGNVGIGTIAPNYSFEVQGAASRNTLALTGDGDVSGYAGIKIQALTTTGIATNRTAAFNLHMRKDGWYGGDGSGPSFIIETISKTGGYAAPFMITPTNDIILNSGVGNAGLSYGNVGIGKTAPIYKLDVNGEINATGFRINGTPISTGGASQWSTTGSNNIYFNTGNVGIGTDSPATKLHVAGGTRVDGPNGRVYLGTSAAMGARGLEFIEENATTYSIRHHDPNVAWQNIAISPHGGNVGIGTATPSRKLHVMGGNVFHQFSATAGQEHGFYTSIRNNHFTSNTYYDGQWKMITAGKAAIISTAPLDGVAFAVYADDTSRAANAVPSFNTLIRVNMAGNVGIGTTPTANKLEVEGNFNATGAISGGTINAKYQDVAEWVESSQALAAGTVVVLDHTRSNQVIASSKAYDTRVAGVISLQPGIALGESGAGKVLVATTGRVKIKVDASAGPIQIGDLLVTSDVVGVAKKSEALDLGGVAIHRPGTLIGKALEPLAKGTGEILVLLSLQ